MVVLTLALGSFCSNRMHSFINIKKLLVYEQIYLLVQWQKLNSNLLRQKGDISSSATKLWWWGICHPLGTTPDRRFDYWQNSLTISHAFYFHVHSIPPDTSLTRLKQWLLRAARLLLHGKRSFCWFPLEKLYRNIWLTRCDLEQCNVTRRVGSIRKCGFCPAILW